MQISTALPNPNRCSVYVSDGTLQTLDIPPAAGRWFSSADQVAAGGQAAGFVGSQTV